MIIIDLDGTFVRVNTFHKWMKFLFVEALKKVQLVSVIKILTIITLRYTKRIDHAKMKYRILEISEQIIEKNQIIQFVKTLDPYIHQDLFKIIQDKSHITILATAAPVLYAQSIKDIYHFDFLLATNDTTHFPWQENIREEKAKNVEKLFEQHTWDSEKSILYTDHHDDIPLMQMVSLTYLVNASEKTKILTRDAKINFELVYESP